MEWQFLPAAIGMTILLWVGATVLSVVLAVPLVYARRSRLWLLRTIAQAWSAVARGIPPLMWLILLYFGFSFTAFQQSPALASIVGLGIVASAYVADGIRAGLDTVPAGQWEAIRATGIPGRLGLIKVILPQAFPLMLASTVVYSIVALKETALASIIGVGELMFFMTNAVQSGSPALPAYLVAGAIYLALTIPLGYFARWIEGRSSLAVAR